MDTVQKMTEEQFAASNIRFAVENLNKMIDRAEALGLKVRIRNERSGNLVPHDDPKKMVERIWKDQAPVEY